jgi:hypothetical protein
VSVTVTDPSGTSSTSNATVGGTGAYGILITLQTAGTWNVTVVFPGNATSQPAVASCTFAVGKQQSTLSLTCPSSVKVTNPATVTGRLTPAGLTAPNVDLTYQPPTGPPIHHSVAPQSDGSFQDSVTPNPNQSGTWMVSASWPGDSNHASATGSCSFTAMP